MPITLHARYQTLRKARAKGYDWTQLYMNVLQINMHVTGVHSRVAPQPLGRAQPQEGLGHICLYAL